MLKEITEYDVRNCFEISCERLNQSFDKKTNLYYFYIRLYLNRKNDKIDYQKMRLVEYHFLDSTFKDKQNVRITNFNSQFEYKFWLYGFIKVGATVIMKSGEIFTLNNVNLVWKVTPEEKENNGAEEFTW